MNCVPIVLRLNKRRRSSNCSRGFTLLEILVAMFILALVMGLIFGTFEGVFSNADRVKAGSDLFEMADAGLQRMTTDLKALYVYAGSTLSAPGNGF